jgi:hypothetical protein
MTLIESGLYDNKSITADDAYDIAEKLVDGKNDVFVELSNNIIEYHKGLISTQPQIAADVSGGDLADYMTTMLAENRYETELYRDLIKVYIEIGNGLDIVAKNYDDRLLVFDDIVKKAGFSLTLNDRFHNDIKAISDLSMYGLTSLDLGSGGEKERIYSMILSEIADYPKLTESLAKVAKEVKIRVDYIEELFDDKRNTELAYSETMTELKTFLASFKDQYKELTTAIVKELYLRLKELANKADECIDNVYASPENNYAENVDFCTEAVLSTLEEIDCINDLVMESLLKDYYSEREFKERGVRLVYEEVKVVDNNTDNTTAQPTNTKLSRDKLDTLVKNVTEWFEKIIATMDEYFGRQQSTHTQFMAKAKDYLEKRSYANVQINILPYDKMDPNQVITDMNTVITNIGNMNANNLKNINTYEDLRSKLLTFGIKFDQNSDERTVITNYYRVGNNKAEDVTYSNNEIRTLVVNHMIPYSESFYSSYQPNVKSQINKLRDAIVNISKTYVTESFNDIECQGNIFTEAEAPSQQPAQQSSTNTQTTQTATTTGVSLQAKSSWITRCIQNYIGCVLNAIRDRNRDYFKALMALSPDQTKEPTQK